MATKQVSKSKKNTREKGTSARSSQRKRKEQERVSKQFWAIILFTLGILMAAIAFIEGQNIWKWLHDGLFGLFGFSAYLLAPGFIYIAILTTMDRPSGVIATRSWEVILGIALLCGVIQIFGAGMPVQEGFFDKLGALFGQGVTMQGGGLFSALLGLSLLAMFGATAAKVTIVILIFLFIMLLTGSTLIGLFHTAKKPIKKMEESYIAKKEERQQRFNIDVPVGDAAASVYAEEPEGDSLLQKAKNKLLGEHGKNGSSESQTTPEKIVVPSANAWPMPESMLRKEEQARQEKATEDFFKDYVGDQPDPVASDITSLEDEPMPASTQPDAGNPHIDDLISKIIGAQQPPSNTTFAPFDFTPAAPDTAAPIVAEQAATAVIDPVPEKEEGIDSQERFADTPADLRAQYAYPSITLLDEPKANANQDLTSELQSNAQLLVDTLKSFGVQTRIIDISRGPAVTRYELQPSAGVKISKITGLADDIALNLAAGGVRIEAPIPNKAAVGIEVPNKQISAVSIREIIDSNEFVNAKSNVSVALGRDISGNIAVTDISKMPHLLIAGSTGSGKSVCINSIIISLLFKSSPEDVKLLLIDPKVVELGVYNGIPHLLVPVVTDPKKAAGALCWAVNEMLKRYKLFADTGVRDLAGFNRLAEGHETLKKMPEIVMVIDELADLMMAAPNEVEDYICRLAQMARAAGMHLIIATQRPSVDIITGVIKANIPSRIAFAVSSQVDSRTILDMGGAEKLLGRGDMLFHPVGSSKPTRIQGCFVKDSEVERVVSFIKQSDQPEYDEQIMDEIEKQAVTNTKGASSSDDDSSDDDPMLGSAIECVIEAGQASTSLLQRRLKLGYARAARLVDDMEMKGIVGPFEGSKPRQVLISKDRWYEMKLNAQLAQDEQK